MHILLHIITITRHRHQVIKNCFRAGIGVQGLFHDLSKYSFAELWPSAKLYQGTRSPNERARELYGYSAAWLHHKGRNKHHLEYWIDYSSNRSEGLVGCRMPVKYVVEMFCDRIAASRNYNKDNYTDAMPLEYFEKGRSKTLLHPESAELLYSLLLMLKEKGEDETFMYIRKNILHNKK